MIGRIEKTGKIDWKVVARIGALLAQALEYAHEKGLIHKNVTPQNVLVGRKAENIKLTDLMLSSATEEDPTKPITPAGAPSAAEESAGTGGNAPAIRAFSAGSSVVATIRLR